MLKFKNFLLKEALLIEAKKKDVLSTHPHVGNFGLEDKHITKYGMHLGKITDTSSHPEYVKTTVTKFDKYQNQLPAEKRDFTQYPSLVRVNDALHPIEQKDKEKNQQVKTVDSTENWDIKRVGSKEAAIKNYGGGKTNWCVAAGGHGNMFDHYAGGHSLKNTLYTIHNKNNPEIYYAYHEGETGRLQRRNQGHGSIDIKNFVSANPELAHSKVLGKSAYGFLWTGGSEESAQAALNHHSPVVRKSFMQSGYAKPEHVEKALNDTNVGVRELAFFHPHTQSKPMDYDKLLNDKSPRIRQYAYQEHPNLSSDDIHKALNDEDREIRISVASRKDLTPDHVMHGLTDPNYWVRGAIVKNQKLNDKHIHIAIKDKTDGVRNNVWKHHYDSIKPEHLDTVLNSREHEYERPSSAYSNYDKAISHPNITSKQIENVALSPFFSSNFKAKLYTHPAAPPDLIDKALNHKDPGVRYSALGSPTITKDRLMKAAEDKHSMVRDQAKWLLKKSK